MCADHDLYFFDLRELVINLFSQNTQFIFLSVSMAADIVKTVKDISPIPRYGREVGFDHI